ncbi:MAG: hypothetical protein K5660_08300 [Paludibacteraceae bacterium]|nr:hypothetical protein [Paludibacteraceae bacterium]
MAPPFNAFGAAKLPEYIFLPKHLEIGENFCIFAKAFSSVSENKYILDTDGTHGTDVS